jgi:hypothetical protein
MIVSVPACARAGHRRVEHAYPALVQRAADAPRVGGGDRRHIHAQQALARRLHDGLIAQQNRLHLRAVDDHAHHHVARRCDLCGRG